LQIGKFSEQLASGQRINSAADDAAGLAISDALRVSTRITSQALRNLNDGLSFLNIADGAASALSSILERQGELSEQAANGIYSGVQRGALNQESIALSAEYSRILSVASFNGSSVFDRLAEGLSLQAGVGNDAVLTIKIGDSAEVVSEIMRVSTSSAGTQGNGISQNPRITSDGRYLVFSSYASNLVAGDTNGQVDIFRKDLSTGTTINVSTSSVGAQGNGLSINSQVTSDGRYIIFSSLASNLVAGDTNGQSDIFIKDLTTGATNRVSVSSAGAEGNALSDNPQISSDGRYIVFSSLTNNLTTGDTNGASDIFITANPFMKETSGLTPQAGLDLSTSSSARTSLDLVSTYRTEVAQIRGQIGAFQVRIDKAISNLAIKGENETAARSRILDADVASVSSQLAASSLQQQLGAAILAQANQQEKLKCWLGRCQ